MEQRIKAGNFRINGVELAPAKTTIEWGRKSLSTAPSRQCKQSDGTSALPPNFRSAERHFDAGHEKYASVLLHGLPLGS
ncbi:MAG TPA: hypothetical protein VMP01_20665 [Pirellulaceae bacterium]|nr:hypothetical protein [Pirellulaceae bacterium]